MWERMFLPEESRVSSIPKVCLCLSAFFCLPSACLSHPILSLLSVSVSICWALSHFYLLLLPRSLFPMVLSLSSLPPGSLLLLFSLSFAHSVSFYLLSLLLFLSSGPLFLIAFPFLFFPLCISYFIPSSISPIKCSSSFYTSIFLPSFLSQSPSFPISVSPTCFSRSHFYLALLSSSSIPLDLCLSKLHTFSV